MWYSVKVSLVAFGFVLFLADMAVGQKIYSTDQQITAAVSAAPESLRAEATVKGYNADTTFATLREGSNNLICIADDPRKSNFHVSCYHKDLEPFMKRGRELKAQGMSRQEVDFFRRNEIRTEELSLPEKPMALYALTGKADAFDYEKGVVDNATPLYVIYVPYATEASTGLSTEPASPGAPWIMEPGTPWAHIMVMTRRTIEQ